MMSSSLIQTLLRVSHPILTPDQKQTLRIEVSGIPYYLTVRAPGNHG